MTVAWSSRDAEGDAGVSGLPHRREAAGAGFSSPARVASSAKPFGSRFWALSSEFEDSDDEIWEDGSATEELAGVRGVGSPPSSRTLGDFLGLALEGGGLAGRAVCRRSSPGPGSPVRGPAPQSSTSAFPPLPGAKFCSLGGDSSTAASFKLQVGTGLSRFRRRLRRRRPGAFSRRRRQILLGFPPPRSGVTWTSVVHTPQRRCGPHGSVSLFRRWWRWLLGLLQPSVLARPNLVSPSPGLPG
jgi:hypothetical protein